MRTALELHGDVLVSHGEARRGLEKAPEDRLGVGRVKPFALSCHVAIQGIGDQGEHDIAIHLERDRGRHGIQMKEIHLFGHRVLEQPPLRVPFDYIQRFQLSIMGHKEGGVVMAQAGDRQLPEWPCQAPSDDTGFLVTHVAVAAIDPTQAQPRPGGGRTFRQRRQPRLPPPA